MEQRVEVEVRHEVDVPEAEEFLEQAQGDEKPHGEVGGAAAFAVEIGEHVLWDSREDFVTEDVRP